MPRYLVVAHQTAESPELLEKLAALAHHDSASEFVLLVPRTRVEHLATWTEGESGAIAARAAERARDRMKADGLNVIRTTIGDESPALAVDDEMREHPGEYDAIVVSTFPLGISKWLGLDLPRRIEKKYAPMPVTHVVAEPVSAAGKTRGT